MFRIALLVLLGCNRDVGPEKSSGGDSSRCNEDAECSAGTICQSSQCVNGDRNNSAEEAVELLWAETTTEWINPNGDKDYFKFSTRGGEYARITTETLLEGGNTVMTLREPNGQVVTWSDDFPTGSPVSSLDSVIYVYLAYEGEYLITVEDLEGYYNPEEAYGRPDYEYNITITEWENHTRDPDDMNDDAYLLELKGRNTWNSIGTVIESSEDSDYIKVVYSAKTADTDSNNDGECDDENNCEDASILEINGIVNLDGSDLTPQVRLLNESGVALSEFTNVGPDGFIRYPNMSEGTYFVEVKDANGNGDTNYWTYLFLIAREPTTAYPVETENNNTKENANAVELTDLETNGGSKYKVGKYFAELTKEDGESIDWYSFNHEYTSSDSYIIICLNSTVYGSTASPTVTLYNDTEELAQETADPLENPNLAIKQQVSTSGDYYFSIDGGSDKRSDWYQFLMYSTEFDPSNFDCP